MEEKNMEPIAVERKDLNMFGCPRCGHRGLLIQRYGKSGLWRCQDPECNYTCIALSGKSKKSCIGIPFLGKVIYPELCSHPREGTFAHSGTSIKEKLEKLDVLNRAKGE